MEIRAWCIPFRVGIPILPVSLVPSADLRCGEYLVGSTTTRNGFALQLFLF